MSFLSLKTDVNVPTGSTGNKQNNSVKNHIFVGIFKVTDEKSMIRIRNRSVRIQGSGSVSKCHGTGPLILTPVYIILIDFIFCIILISVLPFYP
jgi:hypothetical protein